MADLIFNKYFEDVIDDHLSGKTIKLVLIMSNSELETAQETARDRATVSAFGTLDEMDGSGFTWGHGNTGRKTITLTGEVDNTNNLGSLESVTGTYTWSSLGAGTRSVTGVLAIEEGASDDTTAVPIGYFQFASPRPADGNNFVVNFNAGDGKLFKFLQGT